MFGFLVFEVWALGGLGVRGIEGLGFGGLRLRDHQTITLEQQPDITHYEPKLRAQCKECACCEQKISGTCACPCPHKSNAFFARVPKLNTLNFCNDDFFCNPSCVSSP